MAEEYVCDVCGKHLKTAAGLAGHKMFAHPPAKEPAASGSPEQAVVEMLASVKEAYDRLEGRLDDFGSQFKSLVAQLSTVDGRLDGFQMSMVDRIKAAEEEREHAEAELASWRSGKKHISFRSLWDNIDDWCPDCEADKQAIIAELKAQPEAESSATGEVARAVPAPTPEVAKVTEYFDEKTGITWHRPVVKVASEGSEASSEASEPLLEEAPEAAVEAETSGAASGAEAEVVEAQVVRFKVVNESSVVDFLEGKRLPADIEAPKVGSETEDLNLAESWRKAGFEVEEISAVPTPTKEKTPEVEESEPESVVKFLERKKK